MRGLNKVKAKERKNEIPRQNSYDYLEKNEGNIDFDKRTRDARLRFKTPAYNIRALRNE